MKKFIFIEGGQKEHRAQTMSIVFNFFQNEEPMTIDHEQFYQSNEANNVIKECHALINFIQLYTNISEKFIISNGSYLSFWYHKVIKDELKIQKNMNRKEIEKIDYRMNFFRGMVNAYFDFLQSYQTIYIIIRDPKYPNYEHACINPFPTFVIENAQETPSILEKIRTELNK